VKLLGDDPALGRARALAEHALREMRSGRPVGHSDIERWLSEGIEPPARPAVRSEEAAAEAHERGPLPAGVSPRSEGQRHYMAAIASNTIVFAVGPAGTGKTYLAVAAAVDTLRQGRFKRLVLARPAVEAGEKLGFLPGDFQAKVNPYLRPLYDALGSILDPAVTRRYLDTDVIEVCPLAYMRGRTLNHAFIILDEAQNTTVAQMKMFLTRMGEHSQCVVTGDLTQIDLPPGQESGLVDAVERLQGVPDLAVVRLTRADVVRHPIVQRIIDAYDGDSAEDRRPPKRGRSR
jgi:phosphate starvation-inducible PhoH-like protein